MKLLISCLMVLESISAIASALPSELNCSYKLVITESKNEKVKRVDVTNSLLGFSLPTTPLELDGLERTTGESFLENRGITIKVNGNPEMVNVRLIVDNGTKETEIKLLDRTIVSRNGLFERLDVPSGLMAIKNGRTTNKVETIILSCLPQY